MAEVDGRAPGSLLVAAEEGAGVAPQIITLRAEVVVDHIDEDHDPKAVRLVDELAQTVRIAVGTGGGVGQHAVVTPVAPAGKGIQRHQLDGGDAQFCQLRQPSLERGIAAEQADMGLVKHRFMPGPATPLRVAPAECGGVDHAAFALDTAGLVAGGRVRHAQLVIDAVPIGLAGNSCQFGAEPAVPRRLQRISAIAAQLDLHPVGIRGPQREPHLAAGQDLGSMT